MNIYKYFLIIIFNCFLSGNENLLFLDNFHDTICQVLVDTSNGIDNYFVDDNESVSSKTYAEFSTSFAKETYLDFEQDIRFRLRLDLPKIQKNLKLIFEDDSSDDILYDGTKLDDENIKDKRYHLSLEYLNVSTENLRMKLSGGVHIRSKNLVPYANHFTNYDLIKTEKIKSTLSNRFRYYTDGDLEDVFEYNTLFTHNENLYTTWRNYFQYNKTHFQTLLDDISLVKNLSNKKQLSTGLGVTSIFENFQHKNVDTFNLHASYYHLFYKDWMYYSLSPSILKRKFNDYKNSYRLLLNFGIYFKNE